MRKITLFLFCLSCTIGLQAQKIKKTFYYYYNGEKQYLQLNPNFVFISSVNKLNNVNFVDIKASIIRQNRESKNSILKNKLSETNDFFYSEVSFENDTLNYISKINKIKKLKDIEIVSPYFCNSNLSKIGLSNFFYVKLKTLPDTILLKSLARKNNAVIIEQDRFMPLWFMLSCTRESELNALELANVFYESSLFEYSEPDLILEKITCSNDTHYEDQWNLGGNDFTSICINAPLAWTLSTGNNVKVAVFDQGIELKHPDLQVNIYPLSYDSESGSSPSVVYGNHGTLCAGIIGAVGNNSKGIIGVAPNCKLISVSNPMGVVGTGNQMKLAQGINWAWENDADIISNSWGFSVPTGNYISDAIKNAVTLGRHGAGCVVVVASGNNHGSTLNFPASLDEVIAVGAINKNGNRCDFSNYGVGLDVVAPGVQIATTDLTGVAGYNYLDNDDSHADYLDDLDYTKNFEGTSAACPQVAAVAALILAAKPGITGQEVKNIIERTTQKISKTRYTYAKSSNHLNGTWNNEMGYGLVNAYTAVKEAIAFQPSFSGASIICNQATYTLNYFPTNSNVVWTHSSNLNEVSGQGTIKYTVSKNQIGQGWIQVSINGQLLPKKMVWVGTGIIPSIQSIDDPNNQVIHINAGDYLMLSDINSWWYGNFMTNFIWTWDSGGEGFIDEGGMPAGQIGFQCNNVGATVNITAQVTNSCGTTEWSLPLYVIIDAGDYFSMLPNPVSESVNISLSKSKSNSLETTAQINKSVSVKIIDIYGILVFSANNIDKSINIKTSDFRNGIYSVIVSDGSKSYQKKLVVKH